MGSILYIQGFPFLSLPPPPVYDMLVLLGPYHDKRNTTRHLPSLNIVFTVKKII